MPAGAVELLKATFNASVAGVLTEGASTLDAFDGSYVIDFPIPSPAPGQTQYGMPWALESGNNKISGVAGLSVTILERNEPQPDYTFTSVLMAAFMTHDGGIERLAFPSTVGWEVEMITTVTADFRIHTLTDIAVDGVLPFYTPDFQMNQSSEVSQTINTWSIVGENGFYADEDDVLHTFSLSEMGAGKFTLTSKSVSHYWNRGQVASLFGAIAGGEFSIEQVIPEPSAIAIAAFGMIGVVLRKHRAIKLVGRPISNRKRQRHSRTDAHPNIG